jgi:hypothetical protein
MKEYDEEDEGIADITRIGLWRNITSWSSIFTPRMRTFLYFASTEICSYAFNGYIGIGETFRRVTCFSAH